MSTPRHSSSRRRSTRIESNDEVNGATVRRSSSTRRPRSHSTKKTRHAEGETVSSHYSAKKKSSRRSSNSHKSNNNDTEQSPTSSPSNDDVTTPSTRRRVTRSSSAKKRRDDEVDYLTTPKKKSNTQQDGEDWTTVSPSLLYRTNAALDAVKQSCTRYQLLAFDHCPAWLKDNRYIRSGYRANIGQFTGGGYLSPMRCFDSMRINNGVSFSRAFFFFSTQVGVSRLNQFVIFIMKPSMSVHAHAHTLRLSDFDRKPYSSMLTVLFLFLSRFGVI